MSRREKCSRILRLVAFVLLLFCAVLTALFVLPATVHYRVTEHYQFSAPAADIPLFLAVMVPQSGPYQEVKDLVVDWTGTEMHEPHGSVNVLKLEGTTGAGGTLEAAISYDVILRQGQARWQGPVAEFQLAPQPEIESDHPLLEAQALQLAEGQAHEDAFRIYAFTAGHLFWPKEERIGGGQSALNAYQTRLGVCSEFANLMTALNRAAGIPAQSISGLLFPLSPPLLSASSTWNHPAGSHAWVEVHTGERWEMADPSWASQLPFKRLWFGRNDGMHLSYGESGQHDQIYQEMMAWAESRGEMVGAMSAPLKFAATAAGEGVTFQPTVTVKRGWDGRWVTAAGLFIALIVGLSLVERRIERKRTSV